MKITSEIWQVGGGGLTSSQDAAVYLCCFEGRAAIVDAGCGNHTDRLVDNIRACDIDDQTVDYLLLTHCHYDHTGGASKLRSRYGCDIVAHELEAAPLEAGDSILTAANWYGSVMRPLAVDLKLSADRYQIDLGDRAITAIHTPGHTPGSVVYLVESDGQRVLFGQDVHGPLHDDFGSDADAYQTSLSRLIDIGADILCEGHFGVFRGAHNVRQFIRSYL